MQPKKIGLFGFGTVGKGFYENLKKHPHIPAIISKVCVKRLDLPRISHELYFTDDPSELLDDPEIDIIIEVIDDAEAAKEYVYSALTLGKHVISANKKMIGESLDQVDVWHQEFEPSFLYEAAVG
ncbi:MAG: homoserine dehydrogenase, partial [Bacteroidota bacterium]